MDIARQLLFIAPGSLEFLILGLLAGIALLHFKRWHRWGVRWLTCLGLFYWAVSTLAIAMMLANALFGGYRPLRAAADAQGATAIIVLGGGVEVIQVGDGHFNRITVPTAVRVIEGARVYRLLGNPWIIVSGGATMAPSTRTEADEMRDALEQLGVPRDRILLESLSRNTHEAAVNLRAELQRHTIDRFVLVTSPLHMRRAMAALAAQGLRAVPSISGHGVEGLPGFWYAVPTIQGLGVSQTAVYEGLAWVYYWSQGWL